MANNDIVYLDLETTGLEYDDEVLQIAIINDNAEVLLNSYVKPIYHKKWQEAQYIHGITSEDVAEAPSIIDLEPKIKELLTGKILVIYNAEFDTDYLRHTHEGASKVVCCMELFAEEYGDWNDYFDNYQWKKLSLASKYVKHNLENAHNALSDVLATRAVYHYLIYDNELKTIRHQKRAERIEQRKKEAYERDIKNLPYLISDIEYKINTPSRLKINETSAKMDDLIYKFTGYRYSGRSLESSYRAMQPDKLLTTEAVLKEAKQFGIPIIETKTIPSKYIALTRNRYFEDEAGIFDENLCDAIYYNPQKNFRCPHRYETRSHQLLFLAPEEAKKKAKARESLDKIDVEKLKLPIFWGIKIPDGYMSSSTFEEHRDTSNLKPSAYLVPKSKTRTTLIYKISDYKKCDYYYYKNWGEVPNKFWFTKTEMKRRFKIPAKEMRELSYKGDIKLYSGSYYSLFEVPKKYQDTSKVD